MSFSLKEAGRVGTFQNQAARSLEHHPDSLTQVNWA
jgi:hypothetical protein